MVSPSNKKTHRNALVFGSPGAVRQAIANVFEKDDVKVWLVSPDEAVDDATWRSSIKRVIDVAGGLDIFVHAAPVPQCSLSQCSFESFEQSFRGTVGSLWLGGTLCADAMRAGRGGVIVALSATAHDLATPEALYAAMFGEGVRALSASLAVATAKGENGVRINALGVDTSLFNSGFTPAHDQLMALAEMVALLASDNASYMNATVVQLPYPTPRT